MRNILIKSVSAGIGLCLAFAIYGCSENAAPTSVATHVAAKPQAIVKNVIVPKPETPTVTAYNGLLYAEMGPLVDALSKRGDRVTMLWHDAQETDMSCPEYIIGHSMGGNSAIRQADKCQADDHAPKAIVIIDAGRCPGNSPCSVPDTATYACQSFYNPEHPIGGQFISGKCKNTVVPGYSHLQMPGAPGIDRAIFATIPAATR